MKFEVTLSEQSLDMIEQLSRLGIYGTTPNEVAGRFIDQALQKFVDANVKSQWTMKDLKQ